MSSIPAISEWKRIFVDTSFMIDLVRDLSKMKETDQKYQAILRSQKLLEYFLNVSKQTGMQVRWMTSSIVLAELTKFEKKDAVAGLQEIFQSPEIEIINFTRREASFIVNDMANFIEQKNVSRFFADLKKEMDPNTFNPKNHISNDALIIACAKSKSCDALLTSDKNTFAVIAKQVNLPILLSENIPLDMYGEIDDSYPIPID